MTKNTRESIIEIDYLPYPDADCWEQFEIDFSETKDKVTMHIHGHDDSGIIYGILHVTKEYLHIDPYWFWADLPIKRKDNILIPI